MNLQVVPLSDVQRSIISEYRDRVTMSIDSHSAVDESLPGNSIQSHDAINEYGNQGTWERRAQHLQEAQKNIATMKNNLAER